MSLFRAVKSYIKQRLRNAVGVTDLRNEQAVLLRSLDDRLQAVQRQLSSIEDWSTLGLLRRNAADGEPGESLAPWRFPVYLSRDGRPCFQPRQGRSSSRVVVCSIPKSGTYLTAEILRGLGLVATGVHVDEQRFTDYRFASPQQARKDDPRLYSEMPLRHSLLFLLPGQFTVGHLPCTPSVIQALTPFRKLMVYRDLRDAVVSWMRFVTDTGRGGQRAASWRDLPDDPEKLVRMLDVSGPQYFETVRPMLAWRDHSDVFPVAFEVLLGDRGEAARFGCIAELAEFLQIPCSEHEARQVVERALAANTITKSGRRTDWRAYWSEPAERRFRALDGEEMNAALGYARLAESGGMAAGRREEPPVLPFPAAHGPEHQREAA